MTEKIIISKELNEWLEKHQTLDTDNRPYSERFGKKISNELFEKVWFKTTYTNDFKDILKVFGLKSTTKNTHLWLLLNRDKWEVEQDELFYICIPEPDKFHAWLPKDGGMDFYAHLPYDNRYKWTQEEIDKHEVAKHLQHFKKKVEE
ncbi:hypothetical protein [Lactococcus phage M6165]|uniref:hypothetical protein n=1 Tax=Lactococcus phage M6165 TaxID=1862962 RepID=UPI0007FB5E5B|nr:hypothetical protein BI059_gp13 [Lactococcus phage M6165]ANM46834.1 hypothetical protein [Lactococcus phage M6165]